MKKLIVIFLGVLVGSIIPTINFTQEEILGTTMLLIVGNIIFESFFKREYMRYLSIFFSSIAVGLLSISLFLNWNKIAQAITLVVFVIGAIAITAIIGIRENNSKTHGKRQDNGINANDSQEE